MIFIPFHPEGRFANVTNVGMAAVDAAARETGVPAAYGEAVWFLAPRSWRQVRGSKTFSRMTVAEKARSPGERGVSRKAIAQGRPECLR